MRNKDVWDCKTPLELAKLVNSWDDNRVTMNLTYMHKLSNEVTRQGAEIARLKAENENIRAKNERLDCQLIGVMHSVDKWFDDGDPRLKQDPTNRAGDAREIALKAIEKAHADLAEARNQHERELDKMRRERDRAVEKHRNATEIIASLKLMNCDCPRVEALKRELADMTRQRDEHAHNLRCAVAEVERMRRHAKSCAESMMSAHEETRDAVKHLGEVMRREAAAKRELADLRRKVGEWADRICDEGYREFANEMREEAGK